MFCKLEKSIDEDFEKHLEKDFSEEIGTKVTLFDAKYDLTYKKLEINGHLIIGTWKNEHLHGNIYIEFPNSAKFKYSGSI